MSLLLPLLIPAPTVMTVSLGTVSSGSRANTQRFLNSQMQTLSASTAVDSRVTNALGSFRDRSNFKRTKPQKPSHSR